MIYSKANLLRRHGNVNRRGSSLREIEGLHNDSTFIKEFTKYLHRIFHGEEFQFVGFTGKDKAPVDKDSDSYR